jgi:hypothetical protein
MLKINFSKQVEKIIEKLINKEPQLVKLICQKIEENYHIIYEYDKKFLYVIIINNRDKVYN